MVGSHDVTKIYAILAPAIHVAYQSQKIVKEAYVMKAAIAVGYEVLEMDLVCLEFQVFQEQQATRLK